MVERIAQGAPVAGTDHTVVGFLRARHAVPHRIGDRRHQVTPHGVDARHVFGSQNAFLLYVPAVLIDDRAAASAVARHLLDLGHRRFGYVSGPTGYVNTERWTGFMTTLSEAGIPASDIFCYPGNFTGPSGITAGQIFLQAPRRPTAVFAASDLMAFGFMKALRAGGIEIPEEVSVAGFDGIEFATYCAPELTTVRQPSGQMGYEAARLLMRLVDGETIPECELQKTLHTEFILGSSTLPPAAPR